MAKTITLGKPIENGSETIRELTLREPVAGDMRKLPMNPDMGDLLDLAGSLAAQPTNVMNKLSIPDMQSVLEVVGGFLEGSLATGKSA